MAKVLLSFEQCKWPIIFVETVTDEAYLQMLEQMFILALKNTFYDNEGYYFQQDGAP